MNAAVCLTNLQPASPGRTAENPIVLVTPTKDQATDQPLGLQKKRKRDDSPLNIEDGDDKGASMKKVKPLIMNARAGTKHVRPRPIYRSPTPYESLPE